MQTLKFIDAFKVMPLVPALRGISEKNVIDIGQLLIDAGITIFEIPIRTGNAIFSQIDDQALRCIDLLTYKFGKYVNISAGTVMQVSDLDRLKNSGITNCFSINLDTDLLEQAVKGGFTFSPGIETISEAIQAIKLGAFGIKLFPSVFVEPDGKLNSYHSPGYVNYLSKFIDNPIIPSGNAFNEATINHYFASGAGGFNIGGQLFDPKLEIKELEIRAKNFVSLINKYR